MRVFAPFLQNGIAKNFKLQTAFKANIVSKDEILKMLFDEHHRQLSEKRQKIHGIAERTMTLLMVVAGWLMVIDKPLPESLSWIIIVTIAIIAVAACWNIYVNNRAYFLVANVVRKINEVFGLFETGKFTPDEVLYPLIWKNFGQQGKISGFLFHCLTILAATILCIILVIMQAQ